MSRDRPFHVLARDPVAGGSFEEWPGWLDGEGLHFTMSHPPARRLAIRFLLPGAMEECRADGEVIRVDREGERFVTHLRLGALGPGASDAVARFLEDVG